LSGTVETGETLRLFCALDLPDAAVEPVVAWQHRELRLGRIVPPENLHLTLAFLGSRPAAEVAAIAGALRSAVESGAVESSAVASGAVGSGVGIRLRVRGYRETRSVGMLTFEDEGGRAASLAVRLHEALEALGVYEREERPWLPHLTVLRFRERPRLRPALPDLGEVVPSDAAVFISRLRPGGAVYEAVERIPLVGQGG
jgi:2'-5' RNA ligase